MSKPNRNKDLFYLSVAGDLSMITDKFEYNDGQEEDEEDRWWKTSELGDAGTLCVGLA
jgi:hypothetical protein